MQIKKQNSFPFLWSIFACIVLLGGMLIYNNNKPTKTYSNTIDNTLKKSNYTGLKKISLSIAAEDYAKMRNKRDEAIEKTILISNDDDFVKATVNFEGEELEGKIRLKGDWVDHLNGEQWSYRVKLKSGNTVLGMRKFSLQRPHTRNYAGEWLFHQILADNDLLNLQYHFTEFTLNIVGENETKQINMGLYVIEEAFDKQLLERNKRREGVILKLNENPMWAERLAFLSDGLILEDIVNFNLHKDEVLPIEAFNIQTVLADTNLTKQFKTSRALLKGYLLNELKISEVFDVPKLAKFNALCNLFGANHTLIPHNYRFYYNAMTGLLEPIGFDANGLQLQDYHYPYLHARQDSAYMRAYGEELAKITKKAKVDDVWSYPGLKEVVSLLEKEYPDYKWQEKPLRHNASVLKNMIKPSRAINAYLVNIEQDYITLNIENYGLLSVEISELKNKNGRTYAYAEPPMHLVHGTTTLSLRLVDGYESIFTNVKKKKVGFNKNTDLLSSELIYKVIGNPVPLQVPVYPWDKKYDVNTALEEQEKAGNIENFDFLVTDEENKTIICRIGEHKVKEKIIVPPDYRFIIHAGTKLNFNEKAAGILSYSPLLIKGTIESPVEIYCNTQYGQGIAVINAADTSYVENCIFRGLSNPRKYGWFTSGAVNFYESPVKIKASVFKDNRCEDALNVIRTYAELDEVAFKNTKSDAFDGDYITGSIKNCIFGNLGNDAIDVSGSDIFIENTTITKAGDKGLSAGESSKMTANNVQINDCEIAVAAKDKSTLKITNSYLKNNRLAFTAFQKKSEFGAADIIAKNIKQEGTETTHLIENASSLLLNGQQATTIESVKDLMYGVEFGKSSRE